jgi:hypothetical protein
MAAGIRSLIRCHGVTSTPPIRSLNRFQFFFRAPRRRKLVLAQQVEPENKNGRLDVAATPPAETSSASGTTPSVWKKKSVVLM